VLLDRFNKRIFPFMVCRESKSDVQVESVYRLIQLGQTPHLTITSKEYYYKPVRVLQKNSIYASLKVYIYLIHNKFLPI